MLITILPAISVALACAQGVPGDRTMAHAAQARLAEAIADADRVDWVRGDGPTITFAIEHAGEAYQLCATVRGRQIVALAVIDVGRANATEGGELSWLVDEMRDASAVTRLEVDDDGVVSMATREGRSYRFVPSAGRGTNAGVEARWAAQWDA
jgi:hypothetical protein